MPTATTTSPRSAGAAAKRARKSAGARRPRASKTTRSKATRARTARTRAANQTVGAAYGTQNGTRESAAVLGDYAERAVLIPVGAALTARDRVLSSVGDTISIYSSPSRTQAQLRRFERRGATARSRLEREVRKARVRVERELRQRRRGIEKTVGDLEERRDVVAKNGTELANRVQERILGRV